jgi:site-specific recombinase XerD
MGQIKEAMVAELRLRNVSPRTERAYLGVCRRFARWLGRPATEARRDDVRRFLVHGLGSRPLSASNRKMHLAALKFLFTQVLGRDEVVTGIAYPTVPDHRPRVPTADQVRAVLGAMLADLLRDRR